MLPEAAVLARYVPAEFAPDAIERGFRALAPSCCRSQRVDVRPAWSPSALSPHPDNLEWHQDGGGPAGVTRHMVVWASERSTEIKTSDGYRIIPKPCMLVWFDNTRAFHRQPSGTDESSRWFVAVRCSGEGA